MATEEVQQDVSLDSITTPNVEVEHNDMTSPIESSPTKTANEASVTEAEAEAEEHSAEPNTPDDVAEVEDLQKSPTSPESSSPVKPKASVTTEAKKVVKTITTKGAPAAASAVKKVSYHYWMEYRMFYFWDIFIQGFR
jgi:hypothetical protein